MWSWRVIPLLLSLLIGLLVGVISWGFWQGQRQDANYALFGIRDNVLLLGLLALAALALAIFLSYALLDLNF
jgi:hypothetical protein